MKKILLSFFIVGSLTVAAQQSGSIVLVDGMIASSEFVKNIKSNVKSQKVYKSGSKLSNNLAAFTDLSSSDITSVELKDNIYDRISLASLNEQFKLDPASPVFVDGNLFKDTSIKIIGNVLNFMEIKTVDGKQMLSVSSPIR